MASYWYFDDSDNTFIGHSDNDFIYGYGGNDEFWGEIGDDTLDGGDGADTLHGGVGNDTLNGGAGNDNLYGDGGNDRMTGGAGDDEYYVDSSGDVVIEAAGGGSDYVISSVNYTLGTNLENLDLAGNAVLGTGNALNNMLQANTDDLNSTLKGEGGDDTLWGDMGDDILYGGTGNDTLHGGAGDDTCYGGAGNDTFSAAGGSDTAYGEGGNDSMTGSAGDTLYGGAGNDQYWLMADDAVAIEWTETYNATLGKYVSTDQGGTDKVTTNIDDYTLPQFIENLSLSGAAVTGNGNALANVIQGNGNNNTLYGNDGNDTIYGGAGLDGIHGGNGNDTLYGESGDDTLYGEAGSDTMFGGPGNDTYNVTDRTDKVYETTTATSNIDEGGTDRVFSYVDYALTKFVENLYLFESANGSPKKGTGNTLDNILGGNIMDNILDGGAGDDTMNGSAGNDTYYVDSFTDVINEGLNLGTDAVFSSAIFVLPDNVENLTLTGAANLNGDGNGLNNVLMGNTGINILTGGAGDDTLNGGLGNDTMSGGTGNDVFYVNAAGDVVVEGVGEGIDMVNSSINYTLGTNVEDLTLTGAAGRNGTGNSAGNHLYGNTGNNTLTGLGGDDVLDGGAGSDTMYGGLGDDRYYVASAGDRAIENLGEGTDVVWSTITYTLDATNTLEKLVLDGSANINGTGNGLDNEIYGNYGNNILNGGSGGTDTLSGKAGNDTYVVDTGDIVDEEADKGIDTVQTGITYVLTDDVENLTLTGSSDADGTGNVLDNFLTGNSGNNIFYGGAGNDSLKGMGGNDTLFGQTGDDTYYLTDLNDPINEFLDEGTDTVNFASTTAGSGYTLGSNVEDLVLGGTANINGTGNTLDNWIVGNSGRNTLTGSVGNDILNGSTGVDTLIGGTGNDSYWVDNAADVVTESAGGGTDILNTTVTYTLAAGSAVETVYLRGNAAINFTDNEWDHTIHGNSKKNTINGMAGIDHLYGYGGNDTLNGGLDYDVLHGGDNNDTLNGGDSGDDLYGENGNDTLTGGAGGDYFFFNTTPNATTNKDTITDFTHGEDSIRLDNDTFTALGAAGILSDDFFRASATGTAADPNHHILYNTTTGALFYDADGNGVGVSVQFATLSNKTPNLIASDFMVID
jgi:trimeric autotransporter adhesin